MKIETTTVPDYLYKYRRWKLTADNREDPNEYVRELLSNNSLYFSSHTEFNDPFDSSIPIRFDNVSNEMAAAIMMNWLRDKRDLDDDREKDIIAEFANKEDHYQSEIKPIIEKMSAAVGIYSISANCDNVLMWSYYSDGHKGFCVGFNNERLKSSLEKVGTDKAPIELHKIMYTTNYPIIKPDPNSFDYIIEPWRTKSDQFRREQEYRILWFENAKSKLNISEDVIDRVVFGCRMPDKCKDEIRQLLAKRKSPVKFFDAVMDKNSFKLNIIES